MITLTFSEKGRVSLRNGLTSDFNAQLYYPGTVSIITFVFNVVIRSVLFQYYAFSV